MKSNPDNPTHNVVFEPLYKDEFIKKEKVIPPFSLRCEADMNCLEVDLDDVAHCKISDVPLCTSKCPTYNYYLASEKKATTDPIIFKNKFLYSRRNLYRWFERWFESCFSCRSLRRIISVPTT